MEIDQPSGNAWGMSAYNLAVSMGYIGTLEEWLESLNGHDGSDGSIGIKGEDGKSAYQLAVDSGYEGTIEDWLLTLVGPQGIKGDDGIAGSTGSTGLKGDKGDKGEKGDVGLTGPIGLTGATGAAGLNASFLSGSINLSMPIIALGVLYTVEIPVVGARSTMTPVVNYPPSLLSSITTGVPYIDSNDIVKFPIKATILLGAGTRTFYARVIP